LNFFKYIKLSNNRKTTMQFFLVFLDYKTWHDHNDYSFIKV
jgi:hypothetical protein